MKEQRRARILEGGNLELLVIHSKMATLYNKGVIIVNYECMKIQMNELLFQYNNNNNNFKNEAQLEFFI